MLPLRLLVALSLMTACAAPARAQAPASPAPAETSGRQEGHYRLSYGDALSITTSVQPELFATQAPTLGYGRAFPIRPDGRISLPIVGDLLVGGLTTDEVSKRLAERYRGLLGPATFSVNVVKFRARSVSVLGEVQRPGSFDFESYPSFLEALSRGGPTEWSDVSRISLLRGEKTIAVLDLEKVQRGEQVPPALEDHDVILVERQWMKSALAVVPPIISATVGLTTLLVLIVRR